MKADVAAPVLRHNLDAAAPGSSRRMMMALVLSAALLATLVPLSTAPASADSVGCTLAPGNPGATVCLGLYGSGKFLRSTRVSYGSGTPPLNVCRSQAKWTGPLGTKYSSYRSGCVFSTAWFDLAVNQNAPGKWCGTMRSNVTGDKYPSPACNMVK